MISYYDKHLDKHIHIKKSDIHKLTPCVDKSLKKKGGDIPSPHSSYIRKRFITDTYIEKVKSLLQRYQWACFMNDTELKQFFQDNKGKKTVLYDFNVDNRCIGDDNFILLLKYIIDRPDITLRSSFRVKTLLECSFISHINEQNMPSIVQNPLSVYNITIGDDVIDKKPHQLFRKIPLMYPQLQYITETHINVKKQSLHWGQRKLLYTEIEFLTIYYMRPDIKPNVIVVYIGSAAGFHIPLLMKMFPKVMFELYDRAPFCESLTSMASQKNTNVKIHNEFFTDETAKLWNSSKPEFNNVDILFISDIRIKPLSLNIMADDHSHIRWHNCIKPYMSMYKFRLIWDNDIGYMSIKGDIYFQPYAPLASTETRLIVYGKNTGYALYKTLKYEQQMSYFNISRNIHKFHSIASISTLNEYLLTNNYDSTAEIYLIYQWFKHIVKREKILIQDVLDFVKQVTKAISGSQSRFTRTNVYHISKMLYEEYKQRELIDHICRFVNETNESNETNENNENKT